MEAAEQWKPQSATHWSCKTRAHTWCIRLIGGMHDSLSPRRPQTLHQSTKTSTPCYRCGGHHWSNTCCFKDLTCNKCGKTGHIAKVCRSGDRQTMSHTQQISRRSFRAHNVTDGEEQGEPTYDLYHVESDRSEPVQVTVLLNQVEAVMEIDTGASVSIISDATYRALWADSACPTSRPSSAKIQTYIYRR